MLLIPFLILCTGVPTGKLPDCRQMLTTACNNMMSATTEEGDRVLHLQLRTDAFYIPPAQKVERHSANTMDVYSKGDASAMLTPLASVWQDGQYSVTAIKAQKTILIARNPAAQQSSMNPLMALRDSVLREGTIAACGPVAGNSALTHVKLELTKKGGVKMHAQTIEFWINNQDMTLQKLQLNYAPHQLQTRMLITFLKLERLTSTPVLLASARRQVLTVEGKLLPSYAGYRLVDQSTVRPK